MSRQAVKKYWNRLEFVPKTSHKRSNILDFETYLQQRWQEGQQSAKALYEEIRVKLKVSTKSATGLA